MSKTVALAGTFVDRSAPLIAMPVPAVIGIIPSLHGIFDIVSAASPPASASIQRSDASTTVNRGVVDQASRIHSTSLLTSTYHRGPDLSAAATAQPQHAGNFVSAASREAAKIARLNGAKWLRRRPDGPILIATAAGRLAARALGRLLVTEHVMRTLPHVAHAALTRRGSYGTAARTRLAGDHPGVRERTVAGTPRAAVIAPLLANMYLHVLDASVSRVQQHRKHRLKGGWGNRSAPRTRCP